MFKAVWGFDPEEALRAQNAFREASAARFDVAEEIYPSTQELKIPQAEELQVYELYRIFLL